MIREFINRTREQWLSRILQSHSQDLDDALFAVIDDDYGIPMEEIEDDLRKIETDLASGHPDTDVLVDLANGYSCVGALDRAVTFLNRAIERDANKTSALVRLCWYRRFSEADFLESRKFPIKRDYLAHIVAWNPEHVFGRLSLAIWFARDSLEADDSYESMRHINSSLRELRAAEALDLSDLHDWCLLHYTKGLIFTCILPSLGELEKGIQALKALKARQEELKNYYQTRLPFFPKWLWPNLFCLLASAYMERKLFAQAAEAFGEANRFRVSPLLRKRLEHNL